MLSNQINFLRFRTNILLFGTYFGIGTTLFEDSKCKSIYLINEFVMLNSHWWYITHGSCLFFSVKEKLCLLNQFEIYLYTQTKKICRKTERKETRKGFFLVIIDEENRIKSQIHLL